MHLPCAFAPLREMLLLFLAAIPLSRDNLAFIGYKGNTGYATDGRGPSRAARRGQLGFESEEKGLTK
jgi:hypothetical protein